MIAREDGSGWFRGPAEAQQKRGRSATETHLARRIGCYAALTVTLACLAMAVGVAWVIVEWGRMWH